MASGVGKGLDGAVMSVGDPEGIELGCIGTCRGEISPMYRS